MVWNYFFGENSEKLDRQKLYLILTSYLSIPNHERDLDLHPSRK